MSSRHVMRDKNGRFCSKDTITKDDTLYVDGRLNLLNHVPYHEEDIVQGYKGFHIDMKCNDYQYELNKAAEHHGPIRKCASGLHYCRHPLAVFQYYPPSYSIYAKVEALKLRDEPFFSVHEIGDTKEVTNWIIPRKLLSLSEIAQETIDLCSSQYFHNEQKVEQVFIAGGVAAPAYSRVTKRCSLHGVGIAHATESMAVANVAITLSPYSMAYTAKMDRAIAVAVQNYSAAVCDLPDCVAVAFSNHSVAEVNGYGSVGISISISSLVRITNSDSVAVSRGSAEVSPNCERCVIILMSDKRSMMFCGEADHVSRYVQAPKGTVIVLNGNLGPSYVRTYVVDDYQIPANQKVYMHELESLRNGYKIPRRDEFGKEIKTNGRK